MQRQKDSPVRTITLGHSPDPDDAFMFYALAAGKMDTGELRFEHILQDIQTLNERATRGELDVTAISIHAYASVLDKYALLPSGASMGDGYGPMVVSKMRRTKDEIAKMRIAVPGRMTSAFLALRLWLGRDFDHIVVPFDQVFASVKRDDADAGLIIHEGQLTYQKEGLQLCVDLGAWWKEETGGLPLPLGGNAIKKSLGAPMMSRISRILTDSIRYGLDHRAPAVAHAMAYARDMDMPLADKFVGMYVNDWTLDYGDKGREAIRLFLRRGHEAGIIPQPVELEFVQ
jgi:1,4-dihydroxy-6-naphthoate synthase